MGEFIVYETDERMYFLKKLLADKKTERDVHVFAPNILIGETQTTELKDGDVLVAGRAQKGAEEYLKQHGISYFNMMEDEKFQAVNAELTAEGTLSLIIEHSMLSLKDMRVLVIGFGRTGAAVTRLLSLLGTCTDVATQSSIRPAGAFANKVIPSSGFDFGDYDVVVNTAPASIISDNEILTFKSEAVYIDLASKPALSLCFAKYLGLDAEIYPAIPAKTSPASAAKAIYDFITEAI